jgi:modulator of FtsH protease
MHGYDVATWRTFFLAMIGTAATLTGLLFVSVSINLDRILSGGKFLPARARETLASLVLIVAYSSLALVPQKTTLLGIEIVVMAAPLLAGTLWDQLKHLKLNPTDPLLWSVSRIASTAMGTIPATLAGASLIVKWGGGFYLLVPASLLGIFGAVYSAWVLLIEIAR